MKKEDARYFTARINELRGMLTLLKTMQDAPEFSCPQLSMGILYIETGILWLQDALHNLESEDPNDTL